MTYKRQLPEQIASHTYRRQLPKESSREQEKVEQRRSVNKEETPANTHINKRELSADPRPRQRVVTVPKTDPSTAWNTFAQRQERRRKAAARERTVTHVRMEARTYART